MAREFARAFYHSKEWKDCRETYIQKMHPSMRGLCEQCYQKGLHILGEELHHIVWLTPQNIHDRNVTLNHSNLILLCFECHKKIHVKQPKTDVCYSFDENGNLIQK